MKHKSVAIIVNWNSWGHLVKCLELVYWQTVPFHRVLVLDNNSDSVMPGDLQNWIQKDNFKLIHLPSNLGFAKANNIGIKQSDSYDWVALINPDAYLDPKWHELMLDAVTRYPGAGSFASTLIKVETSNSLDGMGDAYHLSGLVWRIGHNCPLLNADMDEKEVFSPCAAAAFYKREAVIRVGGFDEDFFCYVEDVDLGFRFRLLGFRSVLIPRAIAFHVGSATTGGQHSDFAVYHGHRNLVWTFIKDMPGFLFWLLLPAHLVLNLISVLWFSWQGQGWVILRAKWDALTGVTRAWRKRQQIQKNRRCSVGEIWRMLDKSPFQRK